MEATEAEARATLRDAARAALEVEVPCAAAEVEREFRAVSAARDALEARRAMARLRALLPVRIDEERGGRAAPRGVRACEWRVPDAIDDRGFDAHELAAGLGALMHFSALASRYLDAPRLHRGSHAASQSYVWAPTSAWDDVDSSVWENKGTVHVRDFAGVNSERLELFLPARGRGRVVRSRVGSREQTAAQASDSTVDEIRLGHVRAPIARVRRDRAA